MAAWVVNDAAKTGNTKPGAVYVNLPDFPILTSLATALKQHLQRPVRTAVRTTKLSVGFADLKKAPDNVVSFLRAHPDTKYVITSTDSLFLGLPAALKAAGLNDVKIFGEGPIDREHGQHRQR